MSNKSHICYNNVYNSAVLTNQQNHKINNNIVSPKELNQVVHQFESSIGLKKADEIIEHALKYSLDNNLLPFTIVVMDNAGSIVSAKREDGAALMRFEISVGKAWACLSMGMNSNELGDRFGSSVSFQTGLISTSNTMGRGWITVPGGVLLLNDNNKVIGSIGISGDSSQNDEKAAIHAAHMANIKSDPHYINKT